MQLRARRIRTLVLLAERRLRRSALRDVRARERAAPVPARQWYAGAGARTGQPVRAPRQLPVDSRTHGRCRRRRAAARIRIAEGETAGGRIVRGGTQAPAAGLPPPPRRRHLAK